MFTNAHRQPKMAAIKSAAPAPVDHALYPNLANQVMLIALPDQMDSSDQKK
jgi:hypothetical protein